MKKFLLIFILAFPLFTHAAVDQMSGAETCSVSEANSSAGTVSVSTTIVHSGECSFRSNPSTTSTGNVEFRNTNANGSRNADFSTTQMTNSFWFYPNALPTTGKEIISATLNTSNGTIYVLYINPDGTITLRGAAATTWVATSTTALSTGQWYHVCAVVTSGSSGAYSLKIDNVDEFSGTANFGSAVNYRYFRYGKSTDTNSNTVDFFYDDIVQPTGSDCNYYTSQIKVLRPDANGTYTGWTLGSGTSDWTQIDERVPDGSTTYVASNSNASEKVSFNASSTATVGISGTIHAVKTQVAVQEAASNNDTIFQALVISGATESATTSQTALSNSYVHQEMFFTTDPDTGVDWTTGGVDGIQLGGVSVFASTTTFRISHASAQVLFTPSAGGSTPTPYFDMGVLLFE